MLSSDLCGMGHTHENTSVKCLLSHSVVKLPFPLTFWVLRFLSVGVLSIV